MSRFDVIPAALGRCAGNMEEYSRILYGIGGDIEDIQKKLEFSDDIQRLVGHTLSVIAQEARREAAGCTNMSSGLSGAVSAYQKTEDSILGKAQIAWSGVAKIQGREDSATEPEALDFPEWIYKMLVAALGPFGTSTDAIIKTIDGKPGNVISDIFKLIGGAVKNLDGSDIKWKDWFGLKYSDKGAWESAIGKYTNFSTGQKAVSTSCNWAAQIIASGFGNYEEFGNFGVRFWEETATETLLKIGEGVLVSAGVSAAIAAAGFTAPVIVTGVVVAGVTYVIDWGLDSLVTWVTDGSQTSWLEAASDFICDTGEKAADWLKETGEKIGNDIKDGFNNAVNAVQNFFGNGCTWGALQFG